MFSILKKLPIIKDFVELSNLRKQSKALVEELKQIEIEKELFGKNKIPDRFKHFLKYDECAKFIDMYAGRANVDGPPWPTMYETFGIQEHKHIFLDPKFIEDNIESEDQYTIRWILFSDYTDSQLIYLKMRWPTYVHDLLDAINKK